MELTSGGLSLVPATQSDIDELDFICQEMRFYFKPDPGHEQFHVFSCFLQDQLIGFISFYEKYPDDATACISSLFLRDNARHQGAGTLAVKLLSAYFTSQNYSKVRVTVSLKNPPALHFWFKQGFDKITFIACHKPHASVNYGCIELEKLIS